MKTTEKILQVMAKERDRWFSSSDLAKELGLAVKTINNNLRKLLKEGGKIEVREENIGGAAVKKFYRIKPATVVSETTVEIKPKETKKEKKEQEKKEVKVVEKVEPKEEKEEKTRRVIVQVNGVKILEVDNVKDVKGTCQDIIQTYFGKDMQYDMKSEGDTCIVDVKIQFRTKG